LPALPPRLRTPGHLRRGGCGTSNSTPSRKLAWFCSGPLAGFYFGVDTDGIPLSDPIVGHDKLPVRVDLVADDDLTVLSVFGKRVFQSVDHELGDDKAEVDGPCGAATGAAMRNKTTVASRVWIMRTVRGRRTG
jgi:hypothetical protein